MFWQSGLSRRYKQAVLNTVNTTSGHSASSLSNNTTVFRVPNSLPSDLRLNTSSHRSVVGKPTAVISIPGKTPIQPNLTSTTTELKKTGFFNNNIKEEYINEE